MTKLLVDTNVVVWLLLGLRDEVTAPARRALEDEANAPHISAASVWEIAIKRSLGKLVIEEGWVAELSRLDLVPLPVSARHAAAVERLPWKHRDPFDRLLVAQALTEEMTLVSADEQLAAYGGEVVW